MTRTVLILFTLSFCLSTALLAQAPAQEHPIIRAVESTGIEFSPEFVSREWRGDQAAHDALVAFLQKPPANGNDWRTAISYLSVVDAYSDDLTDRDIDVFRDFATNDRYFGSNRMITQANTRTIPTYASAAKSEVVFALGRLLKIRHANIGAGNSAAESPATKRAEGLLVSFTSPLFWAEKLQWNPDLNTLGSRTMTLAVRAVTTMTGICSVSGRSFANQDDELTKFILASKDKEAAALQNAWRDHAKKCPNGRR